MNVLEDPGLSTVVRVRRSGPRGIDRPARVAGSKGKERSACARFEAGPQHVVALEDVRAPAHAPRRAEARSLVNDAGRHESATRPSKPPTNRVNLRYRSQPKVCAIPSPALRHKESYKSRRAAITRSQVAFHIGNDSATRVVSHQQLAVVSAAHGACSRESACESATRPSSPSA